MIRFLKLIFEQIVFAAVVVTCAYTLHGAKKTFTARYSNITSTNNPENEFEPGHILTQEEIIDQEMKNFDPNNRNLSANFVIEIGDGDESDDGIMSEEEVIDDKYKTIYVEEDEADVLNVTSFTERRRNCLVKKAEKAEYVAVPLLSFPGCGNTWTRYLIEHSTGIFTGSVYHDNGLWKGGYEGELEDPFDGNTIVQKVHRVRSNEFSGKMFRDYKAPYCLFLMRDPKYAFKSEFTRFTTKNHKGELTNQEIIDKHWGNWTSRVDQWIPAYSDTYKLALQYACRTNYHIVFFENMKHSPEQLELELQKIARLVSEANEDKHIPFDVSCLEEGGEGNYKRKHVKDHPDISFLFTDAQKQKMNQNLVVLNKTLKGLIPDAYFF